MTKLKASKSSKQSTTACRGYNSMGDVIIGLVKE